jgi:hypothetical protein
MTLTASRGNAAFVLPGFVRIAFSMLIIFPQIDQWQCILRHKPHNCSVLTPKILFLTGFEPTIFLAGVHVDRARIDLLQRVLFKQFQLCSTIFLLKYIPLDLFKLIFVGIPRALLYRIFV